MSTAYRAFADELTKISKSKHAMDPATIAALVYAKIGLGNILTRHGHRIPGIPRLAQELAGIGLRTGAKGYPKLSLPIRELVSTATVPSVVGLYEKANRLGRALGPDRLKMLPDVTAASQGLLEGFSPELAEETYDFAKRVHGIPLEATGWRKGVDYLFKPVGEVAKDVGRSFQKKPPTVFGRAYTPLAEAPPKLPQLPIMPGVRAGDI